MPRLSPRTVPTPVPTRFAGKGLGNRLVAQAKPGGNWTARLEARIAATLANTGKQVQSLFTLVHAQFALTNSLLQYVLTCVVEPPAEVLPAARARAKARYAKILRLAGEDSRAQVF